MDVNLIQKLKRLNSSFHSYQINSMGCFLLESRLAENVFEKCGYNPDKIGSFFFQMSPANYISRSIQYYGCKNSAEYRSELTLLVAQAYKMYNNDASYYGVLNALIELFTNYITTVWYNLWCWLIDNPQDKKVFSIRQSCNKLLAGLNRLIAFHVRIMFHESAFLPDFTFAVCIDHCDVLYQLKPRLFREFDNKIRCCNEVVFSMHHIVQPNGISNLVFPIYGSIMLALYARALTKLYFNETDINIVLLRIGFHDQLDLELDIQNIDRDFSKYAPVDYWNCAIQQLYGRTSLIIDDNLGRGSTIRYCKKLMQQLDCDCYSRVAETSWNLYLDQESDRNGLQAVDYPSLFCYTHYTQQIDFISRLRDDDKSALTSSFSGRKQGDILNPEKWGAIYSGLSDIQKYSFQQELEFMHSIV